MSGGNTNDTAFAQALGDLKRRGSNLLLVGTPAPEAHRAACERLLGDETAGSRRHLFVLTDGTHDHTHHRTDSNTRVITRAATTRSAAATQAVSAPTGAPTPREIESDNLGELSWGIAEELIDLEDEGDAGTIRLCFDSLSPILEDHDREEVVRFLHALTNRVRASSAMAHYHLPVERDSEVVRDVENSFDAVIQLRLTNGVPEQRWHILQEDLDSGWLQI